jgi:hypothetical protein
LGLGSDPSVHAKANIFSFSPAAAGENDQLRVSLMNFSNVNLETSERARVPRRIFELISYKLEIVFIQMYQNAY